MRAFVLLSVLIFSIFNVSAQQGGIFSGNTKLNSVTPSGEILVEDITALPRNVKNATLKIKADFGEVYELNTQSFQYRLTFKVVGLNTASEEVFAKNYTIDLTSQQAEAFIQRDLSQFIEFGPSGTSSLKIVRFRVSDFLITDVTTDNPAFIKSKIQLTAGYEIEYGIDVKDRGNNIQLLQPLLISGTKSVVFTWTPYSNGVSYPYPSYQFQLLRLYNKDASKTTDENIKADIDWRKATTIETESNALSLKLSISEGTGFYVWRVRPVGTFYDGGISDSRNHGLWNRDSPVNGQEVQLPRLGDYSYFFFEDADDKLNYIYSRTFTEKNKIHESISYANGLLQPKQTQAYDPATNKTITSQSVNDYQGRAALQSVPVPVDGEMNGYKDKFMTSGGKNYSEADFDSKTRLENGPAKVDATSPAGSYYTGKDNLPSAEGYPYTRTTFYDDGSGRVKEQSGVGSTHMVKGSSNEDGKTVRTKYATPSQDELYFMFGSDAPNNESVQKVITIDQNNIASVAYTGKDGNTIATALSFSENENPGMLPVDGEVQEINVKDKLKGGVLADGKYISSKRLTFTSPTVLVPEYVLECQKFTRLCGDLQLDCKYKVQVIIRSLKTQSGFPVTLTADVSAENCTTDTENTRCLPPDQESIIINQGKWKNADGTVFSGSLELPAGDYTVEKILTPGNDFSVEVKNQEEKIDIQVGPLKTWITSTLKNVTCPEQLELFYTKLLQLSYWYRSGSLKQNDNFFNCIGCTDKISFTDEYWKLYSDPRLKPSFKVVVYDEDGIEQTAPVLTRPLSTVIISTPCCEYIKLDVSYKPPFKCPKITDFSVLNLNKRPSDLKDAAGNLRPAEEQGRPDKLDVNTDYLLHPEYTEYFYDFEGYAISMLQQCNGRGVAEAKDLFYTFMKGWEPGQFNEMVFHMITDKYSCESGNPSVNPGAEIPPHPRLPGPCDKPEDQQIPGTQYSCSQLSQCWSGFVSMLAGAYCTDPAIALEQFSGGGNASNGFDQNNGGKQDKHDNQFDEGIKNADIPGLMKLFVKMKLSKQLRKKQDASDGSNTQPEIPEADFTLHLVDMFLQCTGYKFAEILTPAPTCSTSQHGTGILGPVKSGIATDFDGIEANGEYNGCERDSWKETVIETNPESGKQKKVKDLFPHIADPVYAFKYFEYTDNTYPTLEAMTCYKDPNDCYVMEGGVKKTVPCCGNPGSNFCVLATGSNVGKPNHSDGNKYIVRDFCGKGQLTCAFTKEDWSCNQRKYFYNLLKAYREPTYEASSFDFSCSWMSQKKKWFPLPLTNSQGENNNFILDYADASLYNELTGSFPPEEAAISLPGLEVENNQTSLTKTKLKPEISYIEYKAVMKTQHCLETCEDRRKEFTEAVTNMFRDRCYTFSGCKQTEDDNIVYKETIDEIAEQIVQQCKSQCAITTFTCSTEQCRKITTPTDGNNMHTGSDDKYAKLELGAGGHPDVSVNDCRADIPGEMKNCCTNYNADGVVNDDMYCNSPYTLTYYQQTLVKQAEYWRPVLDVVSMCNEDMVYADVNNDGRRDNYPLWYWKRDPFTGEVTKTAQSPVPLCETSDGKTFVPKSDFTNYSNTPPTSEVTQSTYSPKVPIQVETH
jgi:hypothetical protein